MQENRDRATIEGSAVFVLFEFQNPGSKLQIPGYMASKKPKIQFEIITIFPDFFDSFVKESIIKRAQEKKLIKIRVHNLRDFTTDKHRVVDDKAFGGGIGMVLKVEPIYRAVKGLKKLAPHRNKASGAGSKVVLFTPRGKQLSQKVVHRFSKLDQLIMICGRYEGVDERVAKYIADEQISYGPYVTLGGELGAMLIMEAVSRLIPGVIAKPEFLEQRQTGKKGFIEYPQYTRPETFSPPKSLKKSKAKQWKVPRVLLSGNHQEIEKWRKEHTEIIE